MTWDDLLARLAMIWKPLTAGAALLAAVASTAGVWFHFRESPKEMMLPGTVETQEVRLSSRVGGRVAKLLVSESQIVAQKEAAEAVLMRLEHGARAEEKAAAKAAVDSAAARLAKMQHGYRPQEIEEERQNLQAIEADLQNAQVELNRERSLMSKGASTLQNYDAANARYSRLLAQANS